MSYQEFTRPGKDKVTGDGIAPGSIGLEHLSPSLFSEFRQIQLHPHTGVKSTRVKLQDLEGSFTQDGFLARSPNGNKWRIQVNNSGALTVTAV